MSRPRVLFLSHDATRTGAPIIFLNMIEWLVRHAGIDGAVLLRNGGEIQEQFAAVCPTYQIDSTPSRRSRLLQLIKPGESDSGTVRKVPLEALTKVIARELRPDLVYSNTISNGETLESIRGLGVPVITHVHELDFWMRNRVGKELFELTERNTDLFVTVSNAVSRNLIDRWHVAPARIRMVYGFVPTDTVVNRQAHAGSIRKELEIPDHAFVVGGSGTLDWRKAPEHIIQLARYLNQRADRPVHIVWVGGRPGKLRQAELEHDIALSELTGKAHFVGSKPNPLDYFSAFDVFAMVSREDPFPLVIMEAASLGIPTICFADSGGSPEFVAGDCGIEVPYLDLNEMANQILRLMNDSDRLQKLGRNACAKVAREHSLATQGAKIAGIISELLERKRGNKPTRL